jgi:predicted Zn-dependent peptidase
MKHSVYEHKLASGAKGLVIDVPGSAVVNIRITFHSGFAYGEHASYEVPHVMEHLLATVTKQHAQPNAFMIEAQKNGAYVNASTSVDTNEYIYECAAFELDRIIGLIGEQVCEPLFENRAFAAEISNVREELARNTTQHMSVCSVVLAEHTFPRLWLGYDERIAQLERITLEQVERHYYRTHTAANARFYLSGHFPDGGHKVVARLEKIFDRLGPGERLTCQKPVGKGLDQPLVTHQDIGQLYYRSGMYFGELSSGERAVLAMIRMLLTGGMGSRVMGEARRRGLAYSVAAVGHAEAGNSDFGFAGYVTTEHAAALFEVMKVSMRAIAAGECTTEELASAKDLLIGSITRSAQTAGDILGWYVDWYDDEGEIRDFDAGLQQLRDIRLEEIVQLGQQILATKRRGVSLLGKLDRAQSQRYNEILATF